MAKQLEQEKRGGVGPEVSERRSGKYLTFFLNKEEYGLGILKVQEIIGKMPITPVPNTPPFVRGVINLRGRIIPIVDLKLKFGMGRTELKDETCIIVVQTPTLFMGVLVDKVSEVSNIGADEIEETPSFGAEVKTEYLLGVGKAGDHVRLLLDIEKTLNVGEALQMKDIIEGVVGGAEKG